MRSKKGLLEKIKRKELIEINNEINHSEYNNDDS